MSDQFKNRHFLDLTDFRPAELQYLIDLARKLKAEKQSRTEVERLKGKNIALIFEKLSTRTRAAFEVAAYDQGAHVTYIGPTASHLGGKETIKDTARVLGRMYDGIEYRGHSQTSVEEIAAYAGVPVWNGLTNECHPTQVLADLMTMAEHCVRPFSEMKLCFLGDTQNNTCDSLLLGAAKMGIDIRLAGPKTHWPNPKRLSLAQSANQTSGGTILLTESAREAAWGCDFVYTDVWVSLGEPESAWEQRIPMMLPYQVTGELMRATGNPSAKFMHCLPAFHNAETEVGSLIKNRFGIEAMEVTDEVFESENSVVFDQAENRMHSIKALLVATLGD